MLRFLSFYLCVCYQAFCVTELYYVESPRAVMGGRGGSLDMQSMHDEMCARERAVTNSIRGCVSCPHDPNVLIASFTIVDKNGETNIVRLKRDGNTIVYCSNSGISDDECSNTVLYSDPSHIDEVQETLSKIARATSCGMEEFYLPGMRRILDDSMNRTQDCGHTEPKMILHLLNGALFQMGTDQLSDAFRKQRYVNHIVLNLHSYLYPCSTCKDLLIHFGWYVNKILNKKNISFRICMSYRHENGSRAKPDLLPWGHLQIDENVVQDLLPQKEVHTLYAPPADKNITIRTRRRSQSTASPQVSMTEVCVKPKRSLSSANRKTEPDLTSMISLRVRVLQLVEYRSQGLKPCNLSPTDHKEMYMNLLRKGYVDMAQHRIPRGAEGTPRGAEDFSTPRKRRNEKDGDLPKVSPPVRKGTVQPKRLGGGRLNFGQ